MIDLQRLARRALARPLRFALTVAGRVYVAGHDLGDAMVLARRFADRGIASTLGYFHSWKESPAEIGSLSVSIIEAIAPLAPPAYISIKVPAFGYDPTVLAAIGQAARMHNVLMHLDSHEHATADATRLCAQQAIDQGVRVGLSIPGRWRRSLEDADWASQAGIRIRVVKGEWADPADPDRDLRAGFLGVVDRIAGKAREVAIATHDPWVADQSIRSLLAAGSACELELLNGLPTRRIIEVGRKYGVPVRIYVPFGVAWRPYALAKAAENPRILWWAVRDSAVGLAMTLRRPRQSDRGD